MDMNGTVLYLLKRGELNNIGFVKPGKYQWNEQQKEITEVFVWFFHIDSRLRCLDLVPLKYKIMLLLQACW